MKAPVKCPPSRGIGYLGDLADSKLCPRQAQMLQGTVRSQREDKILSIVCPQGLVTLSPSLSASERKPAHWTALVSLSGSWGDDY